MYWKIKAGEKGSLWKDWKKRGGEGEGIISVGWDIGDISRFSPEEAKGEVNDLLEDLKEEHPEWDFDITNASGTIRSFAGIRKNEEKNMKKGDIVIIFGDTEILGIAEIGEYEYREEGLEGNSGHCYWRSADFIFKGEPVNLSDLPEKFRQGHEAPLFLPETLQRWDYSKETLDELLGYLKSNTVNIWFEKTSTDSHSTSEEWGLGECLASPQEDRRGADIYSEMRECEKGDIVLHYLQDEDKLIGVSKVSGPNEEHGELPGDMGGDWAGREGYRVPLEEFKKLDPSIKRSDFLDNEEYKESLRDILEETDHKIFYNRNLELNQGHYLTKVPPELMKIFNKEYKEKSGSGLPHFEKFQTGRIERKQTRAPISIEENMIIPLAHLLAGKNVVFFGPPGTGKTKKSKDIAKLCCGDGNYKLVTANGEWTTYDVKGGPKLEEGYRDGFLTEAVSEELKPYWVIIDEINRANLDLAFGEAFTLLDIEYRDEKPLVREEEGRIKGSVYIPKSFRILGTMNSYDRALLNKLGYAFRRRFAFVEISSTYVEKEEKDYAWTENRAKNWRSTAQLENEWEFKKEEVKKWIEERSKNELSPILNSLPKDLYDFDLPRKLAENWTYMEEGKWASINPVNVLIDLAHEISEEIVKFGHAQVKSASKFVIAYLSLLDSPDKSDIIRAVDEAVVAYYIPQLELILPDIRKEISFEEEGREQNKLDNLNRDVLNKLGLEKSSEKVKKLKEGEAPI